LRIGPGVAPKAQLFALRVFGCEGSTDVVDVALEYSVDPNGDGNFSDRLDVVNMSLGSPYGTAFDSSAVASDNAASVGVVVVASAGNSGDTYYITGSPATSGRTISVASSVDSTSILDGFRVNAPASIAGVKPASQSVAFDWTGKSPVTSDLVYPASQPTGCQAFNDANKALIAGKIVLLDWTDAQCGSVTRGGNAVAAGAVGFILADNSQVFDLFITGSDKIPGVSTPKGVGDQLKTALASGPVNVTLTPEYNNSIKFSDPNIVDTLSSFSSRGPRRGDSFLKPDLAAPGESITSTRAGSGNQSYTISGTSMASPHVAGMMAVLRQLHPDWTVAELKALAMNTANNDVRSAPPQDSPIYGPSRIGAGRVDVPDAATSQVIAYNADNPELVSVSFGNVEVVGSTRAVKKIRVLNKSNQAVSYNVQYRPLVDIPGVEYTLSTAAGPLTGPVALPAFGSADVFVTMTANADQMKHTRDQTVSAAQALPRHWISEEAGYVVMTRDAAPTLRVPVHAVARPASAMRSTTNTLPVNSQSRVEGALQLRGRGVNTGSNYPLDEVSIVTAFELQNSSPNDARTPGVANNGDLQYVGVATDLSSTTTVTNPTGLVENSILSFGIATHGDWTTPNEVDFVVFIDTDRDGTDDFALYNTNYASATGGRDASDAFITVLENLDTGGAFLEDYLNGFSSRQFNTVPFNTNVMALPVFAGDLGLTNANPTFNYRVVSYSQDLVLQDSEISQGDPDGAFADRTPVLTYNAARPGIEFVNAPGEEPFAGVRAYFDLDGNSIPFRYDRTAFFQNRSQGALLLHHHNARGNRPEVVLARGNFKVYLPMVTAGASR
jgi:hypothetical protein